MAWCGGPLLALLAGVPLVAANISVNTLDDSGSPGVCALRDAITAANTNAAVNGCLAGSSPGADTITFTVSGTLTLASTLPTISDPAGLTIDGAGQKVTVSGNNAVRVFHVGGGAVATLNHLSIINGNLLVFPLDPNNELGGGVFNEGTVLVANCTLSGNKAFYGGGISDSENSSSTAIINSTITGNDAFSTSSGVAVIGKLVTLTNSTVTGNHTGGIATVNGGTIILANTILANNNQDCFSTSGPVIGMGMNLMQDGSCGVSGDHAHFITTADPLLSPLADNGGPTMTMALQKGSPAIDEGDNGICAAATGNLDQRGQARPFDGNNDGIATCDIGAFEFDAQPPVITAHVDGALGNNGWYVNNVNITWNVADSQGPITSQTGCDPSFVTSDTNGATFTCTATSAGGTATQSVTIKRDVTSPAVSCGAPDGQWHATDITIACMAADATSGLANAANASFSLATGVLSGTETASASTNSLTVNDNAGNYAMAGPIGGNKIDKKAPSIGITSPTATSYLLNQAVAAGYTCSDGGSGVAACAGPVASGVNINTASPGPKTFTVTAKDNVGNSSIASVSYSVNYTFSGFTAPVKDPPSVNTGNAGRTYPLKWQLRDGGSTYISALSAISSVTYQSTPCSAFTTVSTNPLDADASGNSGLRYDGSANQYLYNWSTPSAPGCYTLFLKLDSGQVFPAYFSLK
jgi:hypothetical protein